MVCIHDTEIAKSEFVVFQCTKDVFNISALENDSCQRGPQRKIRDIKKGSEYDILLPPL